MNENLYEKLLNYFFDSIYKFDRNFFLTQFSDKAENLETEGILEMDLRNVISEGMVFIYFINFARWLYIVHINKYNYVFNIHTELN